VIRRWADGALTLNALIWGATFVLVKAALSDVSPVLFLALRFSLATAALMVVFRTGGGGPGKGRAAAAGASAGALLFLGYLLQTIGLRFTTAPKSAFLTGLTSVLVPLLAALVYKNRPQASEVVGVLVATAGLGLLTELHLGAGIIPELGTIGPGELLTLFSAVAFAAYIVTMGHFSGKMDYEILSVSQIGAAAVLALSMFWWAEKPHVEWRPAVVWAILVTGLLATALAFSVQAWAQQYTSSTRTALIYMLEPVFAWMMSYFVVGEGLSGRAAVGAALILGGVMLVEMKPLNPRPHPSE